jgi:hypothetical protein
MNTKVDMEAGIQTLLMFSLISSLLYPKEMAYIFH